MVQGGAKTCKQFAEGSIEEGGGDKENARVGTGRPNRVCSTGTESAISKSREVDGLWIRPDKDLGGALNKKGTVRRRK